MSGWWGSGEERRVGWTYDEECGVDGGEVGEVGRVPPHEVIQGLDSQFGLSVRENVESCADGREEKKKTDVTEAVC